MQSRGGGRGRARGRPAMLHPSSSAPGGLVQQMEQLSASSIRSSTTSKPQRETVVKPPPILPQRSDFGTSGEHIRLLTNHYLLSLPKEDLDYYMYDVVISQNAVLKGKSDIHEWTSGRVPRHTRDECRETCFKVYLQWARDFDMKENIFKSAYNMQKLLYTTVFFGKKVVKEVLVGDKVFLFQIESADPPVVKVNSETLRKTNFEMPTERDRLPLSILDLQTNQRMLFNAATERSQYKPHGRCFYQPLQNPEQAALQFGREIRDGFQKSLRFIMGDMPKDGKPNKDFQLSVNIETKKSPFFIPQSLHITAFQTLNPRSNVLPSANEVKKLTDHQINFLRLHFKDLRCKKKHNERNFTISGIGHCPANMEMFPYKDGNKISVAQYFETVHNITLQYPQLPCVRDEKRNWFPMEVCLVLPNQKVDLKKLTSDMSSQIIRVAAVHPEVRMQQINEKAAVFSDNFNDRFLSDVGMKCSRDMMKVNGRVLKPPAVVYGEDRRVYVTNGSWNIASNKVFRPSKIRCVGVACLSERREVSIGDIQAFMEGLKLKARRMGLTFPDSFEGDYYSLDQLKSQIFKWNTQSEGKLDLVICIMSGKQETKNAVKYVEKEQEVVIQVILASNVQKYAKNRVKHESLLENLLLKINGKCMSETNRSGVNNVILINDPVAKWLANDVMFVGFDVNHPPPLSKRDIAQGKLPTAPSIVGAVASTGSGCIGDFRMETRAQQQRQEQIDEKVMIEIMMKFVRTFQTNNEKGKPPSTIIVYRDGISESQFGMDKNIPAGTVVDTGPVNPYQFDFFMSSHAGIQGCSKPSNYVVLFDDNNFGADDLQRLTFILCHVYQRATKSVSLPAPVYYAHLAASRGKEIYGGYLSLGLEAGSAATSESGEVGQELDYEEINRQIVYRDTFSGARQLFL